MIDLDTIVGSILGIGTQTARLKEMFPEVKPRILVRNTTWDLLQRQKLSGRRLAARTRHIASCQKYPFSDLASQELRPFAS